MMETNCPSFYLVARGKGIFTLSRLRIPWSIFIAAISIKDLVQGEWILSCWQALARYGKNYARTLTFLRAVIIKRDVLNEQVDIFELFKNGLYERLEL